MISPPEWLDQVERCGAAEVPEKVRRHPPLERPALRASGGGAGMKFSLVRPVKAVMLGAGGTGGHIAPHLYRLLYALDRPVRFIICDGDVVEKKNLVRQNFIPRRPGENKARVLAERYASVFGMETEYVPEFIESEERLRRLLEPGDIPERTQLERPCPAGAGHPHRRRGQQPQQAAVPQRLLQDGRTGLHRQRQRRAYRPGGLRHPQRRPDPVPARRQGLPGCAQGEGQVPHGAQLRGRIPVRPQSIAANITAATAVVDIIYNILALGDSRVRQVTFATTSVNIRPTLAKTRRKKAA